MSSVCSNFPHGTTKMGAQGLCTSAETSGYRLAVVFAGRSALASVSLLGATSVVRLETFTYVLPTGFYIIQVRCPLGHLIYHPGGNKTSFILLTDWWMWSLEMWGQPEVRYSSKMQREFAGIKSTWSQGLPSKNRPSVTSVSGWDWT